MIDKNQLYEWQRIDSENGLIEPWWSHPFMDYLKTWNLSGVTWLETGSGASTAWLRSKCFWVDSVESSLQWAKDVEAYCDAEGLYNGAVLYNGDIPDGTPEGMKAYFDLLPISKLYDVISIDGLYRTEMLQWALDHFAENGGVLIADNFGQDFVWISPKAEEIMAPYEAHVFAQPDHTNHEGRPWNTRYWIIPPQKPKP